jgi:hypothetical protein
MFVRIIFIYFEAGKKCGDYVRGFLQVWAEDIRG